MNVGLTLAAEDAADLEVISARLQDAVAQMKDLVYLPKRRRFAALFNRFQTVFSKELRKSDATMMRMFKRMNGSRGGDAKLSVRMFADLQPFHRGYTAQPLELRQRPHPVRAETVDISGAPGDLLVRILGRPHAFVGAHRHSCACTDFPHIGHGVRHDRLLDEIDVKLVQPVQIAEAERVEHVLQGLKPALFRRGGAVDELRPPSGC